MIAKVIIGNSFRAVCFYLCQESKDAEVLASEGVRTDSAQHMAEDFTFQQQLRPTLGKAVLHVALSLRPEDAEGLSPGEVSMLLEATGRLYRRELAKEIGPLKTQWTLVQHFDKDHPHAHLVLNRVDDHGKVIPDAFIGEYSRRACQRVEQQLGLATAEEQGRKQAQREGLTNRQAAADTPRKVRLAGWHRARHTAANALITLDGQTNDFAELADKLKPHNIKQVVSEHQQADGTTRYGVRFELDGHRFKGGEVGKDFTAPKLMQKFAQYQAEAPTRQATASKLEAQLAEGERATQEPKQREAEQQDREAQLLEARVEAQLQEVILTALAQQVPGATSVVELQLGLAVEGVTARPNWQADGQLQEISFAAAAFPGREVGGAALGPQYEAGALSQTLTDQAAQRAAERREAQELRELILAQEQKIADLHEGVKRANFQGDYGKLAEINYGQLPVAVKQLTAYQEQAQSTEAGQLVLKDLAEEAEKRTDARQQIQPEGMEALRHPLEEDRGDWRSWADYKERVQRLGFDILESEGQMPKLQHTKSGETFDLTLMQPGGENAQGLEHQVYQEIKEQESARLEAESLLVHLLVVRHFATDSELQQQLKGHSYQIQAQSDGQIWLQHEPSSRRFRMDELRPNGQDLPSQFQAAATERQQELRRGQLVVSSGPDGSAAERAGQLQRVLEAAGVQVIAGAGPAVVGKVVLEYRYEWNGPQLEPVNQALRQVQAVPGVLVQEQTKGFGQPEAEWPERSGEYGRATLIVPASDKAHVGTITAKLEENGGWINEVRHQRNGTVELDIGYQTQHPAFPALSGMLDRWSANTKMGVQETAYAGLVRGEVREAVAEVMNGKNRTVDLPAQAEERQSADEYEPD